MSLSPHNLRSLDHSMEQHFCPSRAPLFRNVLRLIMAEPIHTRAHDHGGGGDAVDPAGVVAGAGDDIHVRMTETFGGIADGLHEGLVKGGRVELTDDFG